MKVNNLILGPLSTNCYIIEIDNNVLIIDPADNSKKIIEYIGSKNVLGVIVTHYHFDHIGALSDIENFYNIEVLDYSNLNDENVIGPFSFKRIITKGHTADSITIYFEDNSIMFTGDFLFKGTVGRTDLGGNDLDMKKSIELIKNYDDAIVYPGHGEKTTLAYEKENNSYLKN